MLPFLYHFPEQLWMDFWSGSHAKHSAQNFSNVARVVAHNMVCGSTERKKSYTNMNVQELKYLLYLLCHNKDQCKINSNPCKVINHECLTYCLSNPRQHLFLWQISLNPDLCCATQPPRDQSSDGSARTCHWSHGDGMQ